ncbi:hypothetical protein HMPREF9103_03024 [Lentilactobacillus parafarraginis F0439]|uniref:Uncharacterized protein n=1 Tax=Lentilactobacillus parafarraginis F0439 TaxID=797515 RepID=G9ZTD9_9LACO|nr:hypothetical protein HMPREF9103_03024 [Lentilactobacillus parafarraginis F0439]
MNSSNLFKMILLLTSLYRTRLKRNNYPFMNLVNILIIVR